MPETFRRLQEIGKVDWTGDDDEFAIDWCAGHSIGTDTVTGPLGGVMGEEFASLPLAKGNDSCEAGKREDKHGKAYDETILYFKHPFDMWRDDGPADILTYRHASYLLPNRTPALPL